MFANKMLHIRNRINPCDVRWTLLAFSIYTITTTLFLYPMPLHINSVIVGQEYHDSYTHLWQIWWVKEAALNATSRQSFIPLMNHPVGMEHPFLLTMITTGLMALPFSLLFSPVVAYNLQVIFACILSGMTMYWLIKEMMNNRYAGLIGGFIYAFFPNKIGHIIAGHLFHISIYWFPVYVLFLWRVVRRPRWDTALLATLALVPASLVHVMHLAYFILPVTLTIVILGWKEMKRDFFTHQRVGWLSLVFIFAALLTMPFLLPTILLSMKSNSYLLETGTVLYSTDLLAFFSPSPMHPVLSHFNLLPPYVNRVFSEASVWREGIAYLGFLPLGLAFWGLVKHWEKAKSWGVLALVAALLSLGPLLKVGNQLVQYQIEDYQSYVTLPYAVVKEIPLFELSRTPSRFNETTMFAIAILASYGTASLTVALAHRKRLVALLLVGLILGTGFEYITLWPFPVGTAEIPPSIQAIAAESDHGGLLHLPQDRWAVNSRALYYQTFSRRPIVGGFLHRLPPNVAPWSQTIFGLLQADLTAGDIVERPTLAERVAWLRHFNVDYVIFHKFDSESEAEADLRHFVRSLLGSPKFEDNSVAAFPIPAAVTMPTASQLYTFDPESWHLPESNSDGLWQRRIRRNGQLYVYSTHSEIGYLRFTVDSPLVLPTLVVSLNEQWLDTFWVDSRETYVTSPFTLTSGMNVFQFQSTINQDDVFVFSDLAVLPREKLNINEAMDVNFGDQLQLRGWNSDSADLQPGEKLTITLIWKTEVELNDQQIAFVHLLAPDQNLISQHDAPLVQHLPLGSVCPPGCTFSYPVTIQIPETVSPGIYHLYAGIYLWPSLQRLPVLSNVAGSEINTVELTEIRIR